MTAANLTLKVMSFNIASGLTIDGRLDLELTASVIKKAEIDIVGLQEVDQNFSERTDFSDQIKWLANRLEMHAAFGPNLTEHPAYASWPLQAYGNAVLSRHPIKSFKNHLLEKVGTENESEQRGVMEATIEINGLSIAFFTTHLSLRQQQLDRNIEQLLGIIKQNELPAILTGDFNAEPDSPQIEKVAAELVSVFGSAEAHPETYKKQGDHGQKIDYIFYSRNWQVVASGIVEAAASDHRPIFAVLQLISRP